MEENKRLSSPTEVIIRSKNVVRFKAGADLSGKLNRATVEVNEESLDDQDVIEIRIGLIREYTSETDK